MKFWEAASLAKLPKCRSDSYFRIHEFKNKDHFKHIVAELILISEITNSELRITSTLRYFCQAGRLTGFHFEKPLLYPLHSRFCLGPDQIRLFFSLFLEMLDSHFPPHFCYIFDLACNVLVQP